MAVPVTLVDVAHQLRLTEDEIAGREVELQGFINDAAAWVEQYTGHILEARDVSEEFAGFSALRLKAWPIKAGTTPVVAYHDRAGQPVPVLMPRLLVRITPGAKVLPPIGSRWPFVPRDTVVSITFRAGYEPGDRVPGNFRRAMLVLIGAYDADREGGEVFAAAEAAARSLCRSFRWRAL